MTVRNQLESLSAIAGIRNKRACSTIEREQAGDDVLAPFQVFFSDK